MLKLKQDGEPHIRYNNKMSEHDFNLEDSQENLIVLPDWIPRQKSNDSIFGELIRAPSYG